MMQTSAIHITGTILNNILANTATSIKRLSGKTLTVFKVKFM